jgi:CBS domain-containing membrane protein
MHVRDLMERDIVTLKETDSLDIADDVMRLGRIRHMPVVAAGDRLVGILSQRDLFRAGISSVLQFRHSLEKEWLAKIPVEDAMSREVIVTSPDTSVSNAVRLMIEMKIGCLPVVDEEGTLVGLLSETDCLHYLLKLLAQ